ncbi:hypothetical protein JSE7799_03861 [Jannaschia seosinensis]|uniref:Glyoxalase-like domain-containing protein n=2 Tax=Jannaschia seosinensis TaxID=313367 RepID=A0A0M7BGA1_9RHOB|nr:hypothetical protein JSE7799_03861 [Jannaschia seosinensis]
MDSGGEHALMGTHNRLSGLGDGEYMEVIAVNPDAPPPDRPRWFDLDRRVGPPRIGNWILRTDDLDGLCTRLPEAGRPVAVERGPYRWRMAVPEDGVLPFDGCFPALMQWDTPPPTFTDVGLRLTRLELSHPGAPALAPIVASLTDDPRIVLAEGPRRITATLENPNGVREIA